MKFMNGILAMGLVLPANVSIAASPIQRLDDEGTQSGMTTAADLADRNQDVGEVGSESGFTYSDPDFNNEPREVENSDMGIYSGGIIERLSQQQEQRNQ